MTEKNNRNNAISFSSASVELPWSRHEWAEKQTPRKNAFCDSVGLHSLSVQSGWAGWQGWRRKMRWEEGQSLKAVDRRSTGGEGASAAG